MAFYEVVSNSCKEYEMLFKDSPWCIASLCSLTQFLPENLEDWECHSETDENFYVIEGKVTMVVGGDKAEPGELAFVELKKDQLFTVKKNVWHTHMLSEDAKVLVIEDSGTNEDNTGRRKFTEEQKASRDAYNNQLVLK